LENTLELVKKTDDYVIYKKKTSRYAIKDSKRNWINGDEKTKILLSEKLITAPTPKPKEAPAETEGEAPAEEAA
jgi:hypothetical protein